MGAAGGLESGGCGDCPLQGCWRAYSVGGCHSPAGEAGREAGGTGGCRERLTGRQSLTDRRGQEQQV